jgi:F-type H+-transporting ATPase subunit delta
MAGARAAIRYAKAVLEIANNQNLAEVVNQDMSLMANTITESEDLSEMLQSPIVLSTAKKSALLEIFKGSNKLTVSLIDLLITNKRINILGEVASKYNQLFDELRGREVATVTTAIPMTSDLEAKVLSKVKELTSKAVELENIVDESILGGFILRVGDKQYNASIANQLNKLKREFTLN